MSDKPEFDGKHVTEKDAVDYIPLTAEQEQEVRRTEMSPVEKLLDRLGLKR